MLLGALSLLGNIGEPIYMGMTPRELPEGLVNLSIVRVILIALGVLFVGRLLCQKWRNVNATFVMSLATLCIFVGEGVGRVVFSHWVVNAFRGKMIFTSNYIMFTNNVNRGKLLGFLVLFTLNESITLYIIRN